MAKFLVEHQVGFDADRLGYPNLGGCLALALLTKDGLFGFHCTPGNTAQAPLFATFITNKGLTGTSLAFYGSCYWKNRYQHSYAKGTAYEAWCDEMSQIAAAIGYRGEVYGFDTSIKSTHITLNESTYIEYRRNGDTCRTFFKRMSKINVTKDVQGSTDPVQNIQAKKEKIVFASDAEMRAYKAPFELTDPYKGKAVTDSRIVVTKSNKGEMHEVGIGSTRLSSFTIR
jgi:hypothetical protein